MHAATIGEHQDLTHEANEIVNAWTGTDPMASEADVRRALTVDGEPANLEALLPYVVDVCRTRGLLVAVRCAVCGREGHTALDLGTSGAICHVNRVRAS